MYYPFFHVPVLPSCSNSVIVHKGAKCQKPARNRKNILGQLTVLTYACKTLTNLEYKVHVFTGNGNVENALKTCEIPMKQNGKNLFLASFRHLVPLCSGASMPRPPNFAIDTCPTNTATIYLYLSLQ